MNKAFLEDLCDNYARNQITWGEFRAQLFAKCVGDPGECAFNGACMYACDGASPVAPEAAPVEGDPTHLLIAKVRALALGLAEQQAMPDDWWKPHLADIIASIAAAPRAPGAEPHYLGKTMEELAAWEWRFIHGTLVKAQKMIEESGVRHSWMDPAVAIAKERGFISKALKDGK